MQLDMVPMGHWSIRDNIYSFWKKFKIEQMEEANLAVIKPAEYKAIDMATVVENQQHLPLNERNELAQY
jgi:hypothetical protein